MLFTSTGSKKSLPCGFFRRYVVRECGSGRFHVLAECSERDFADPVQDALYDSGPRPLVVSGELWAEVILLLDDLPDENWGCDVVEDKCPQTAKRAGRD